MIIKSIILGLLFLLPIGLFSYELNFNKKFSKNISSNILISHINITIEDKEEEYINETIGIFNEYIEDNEDVIKKNGNFNLLPKYKYYDRKQHFVGYVGSLMYNIESINATSINKFINELLAIKNKFNTDKIKINISNTTWNISQKLYEDTLDSLRLDAITWIKFYSSNLSTQCRVKRIDINNRGDNKMPRPMNRNIMSSRAEITPIQSEKQISINPSYTLECK